MDSGLNRSTLLSRVYVITNLDRDRVMIHRHSEVKMVAIPLLNCERTLTRLDG